MITYNQIAEGTTFFLSKVGGKGLKEYKKFSPAWAREVKTKDWKVMDNSVEVIIKKEQTHDKKYRI